MAIAASPVFRVAPLAARLLEDPIAFLSAEHARQMVMLSHLDRLARAPSGRAARAMAGELLRWLTQELPVHIADEERSLHPRLAAHDADGILARMQAQHRRDNALARTTVAGLRHLLAGEEPEAGFAAAAAAFARLHRAHLDEEETRLAPLARAVLDNGALRDLAREMAARRGLAAGPGA